MSCAVVTAPKLHRPSFSAGLIFIDPASFLPVTGTGIALGLLESREKALQKKGRERTPCPNSTANCARQLGVEAATHQAEAGKRQAEEGHRRATFGGLGGLMDRLDDGGRSSDATREGGEEDILGHVHLVEGGVDDQLIAREGFSGGIFQVADRGSGGGTAGMSDAGLRNDRAAEASAANGFTDEDEATGAASAQDERLIDRRDQGSARGGRHGVIEVDVPGIVAADADERSLDGEIVRAVRVGRDINGRIARVQLGGAEREIGEDFVADRNATIVFDELAKIGGCPVGRGRSAEERRNRDCEFEGVLHVVKYLRAF